MKEQGKKYKTVKLFYFTGTGSTAKAAGCFEKTFISRGINVVKQEIRAGNHPAYDGEDLVVLVYAVHACNAPQIVYEWIKRMPEGDETPAVVISVSGGGEITPNTACRVRCIRRLKKKKYHCVYEKMLVMPSNWIVKTHDGLAVRLLGILPHKVEGIVNDLLSGIVHRTQPKFVDSILSVLGELEKTGTNYFSRNIQVSSNCTGCGWCAAGCPTNNICTENGIPKFNKQCLICLKCIYGCPNHALSAGVLRFIVVKEGYDLKALEEKMPNIPSEPVEEPAKGYLWSGVKKYLLED